MVGSDTRNSRAMSAVARPLTARSVSASREPGSSAGWQHKEDEAELVVAERVAVVCRAIPGCGVEGHGSADSFLGRSAALAAERVERFVAGGGDEPCPRVVWGAGEGPCLECSPACFLHSVLREG